MRKLFFQSVSRLLVLLLFFSCSMLREERTYFIHLKPSSADPALLQRSVSAINKRLKAVYDDGIVANAKNGMIELEVHERVKVKDLLSLVLPTGKFRMQEAFTNIEIRERMMAIDSGLTNLGYLGLLYGGVHSVIGEAGRYDTAGVMQSPTIKALKDQYNDFEFMWGIETKDWTMPLYAVKKKSTHAELDNESVLTARPDIDEYGSESVYVELKKEYHDAWSNMTRENVGRPIVLCVDNTVLSAPRVNSEIPNGKLVISGSLDGDTKFISALLTAEVSPVSLSVVYVDPQLADSHGRSYPTQAQVRKYDEMQKEFIRYRHGIDSLFLFGPVNLNAGRMRREVARVINSDLAAIVDDVGFTEEQVDLYLEKVSAGLQAFKMHIDPKAARTPQSLFDSLDAIDPETIKN